MILERRDLERPLFKDEAYGTYAKFQIIVSLKNPPMGLLTVKVSVLTKSWCISYYTDYEFCTNFGSFFLNIAKRGNYFIVTK